MGKRVLQLKCLELSALGFPVITVMSASHTHTHLKCSQRSKRQAGAGVEGDWEVGWLNSLPQNSVVSIYHTASFELVFCFFFIQLPDFCLILGPLQ